MKLKNIIFCGLLWGAIYFITNNLNLFTPHALPLILFEQNIVMNEWWMIPYVSWALYIVIFCLFINKEAKQFVWLTTGLVVIHAVIFVFYPVVYPRTYDLDSLCKLNQFLLSCDNPQNCLPSLHISLIFLTLLSLKFLGISQRMRYLFIIWGIIIMMSVIFVKQHYVIDILAGLIITAIYFYLLVTLKRSKNGCPSL